MASGGFKKGRYLYDTKRVDIQNAIAVKENQCTFILGRCDGGWVFWDSVNKSFGHVRKLDNNPALTEEIIAAFETHGHDWAAQIEALSGMYTYLLIIY